MKELFKVFLRAQPAVCSFAGLTFSSHGQRAVLRNRREETGVVGHVGVRLPAEVSIFSIVGRRAWNKVASGFGRMGQCEVYII